MARNDGLEWMRIAGATMALAFESAGVIGLRTAKAARGGPKATDEVWRMYSEKVAALAELQTRMLFGSLGATPAAATMGSLTHYRRKVAANRRRLLKS
jgi:hypothetical protein